MVARKVVLAWLAASAWADHRFAALHDLHVYVLRNLCMGLLKQPIAGQRLVQYGLAGDAQGLQVAGVAVDQTRLAIADVDRMGRAVDHYPHDLQLRGQRTLGIHALADQVIAQR
ncbi:hypothetical protein AO269_16880 [Pseudomonas putida]|nr:hypothetical protein AO269_16880 [Pseudomonas putida]